MTTTQTARRPATSADLAVGNIVYKGNGKQPWIVLNTITTASGRVKATVAKPTSITGLAAARGETFNGRGGYYSAAEFTVSE